MKKVIIVLFAISGLFDISARAQSMKEYKAGHVFNISLPDYMTKTTGFNDVATIQFKSDEKDVYGFVIVDTKEELSIAGISIASVNEFYEMFIKDFVKDESKRKVSKPGSKKLGDINFIEADISYYDNDAKTEIYYMVGIVETKAAFYKVLCWTTLANKSSAEGDFEKILYSVND